MAPAPKQLCSTSTGHSFLATVFAPTVTPKATLFCLPGGGANAQYFDLTPEHSFAQIMAAAGYAVITMDHPGTATNALSMPHPFLTPRQCADYTQIALTDFLKSEEVKGPIIGVGHSMGGMMITLLQARRPAFAAIALLGSSAGGLEWGLSDEEKRYMDDQDAISRDLEPLTLKKFKVPYPPGTGGPSGKSITFGGQTPKLTQRLRETSCELYAAGGMMSMTRGSFKTEVQAITVPLFFAFGDHDIGIPPKDAPADYINAPSSEVHILKDTGHNSFAFDSVQELCSQMDRWISAL